MTGREIQHSSNEIQLIADEKGLTFLGVPGVVEELSKEFGSNIRRLSPMALSTASSILGNASASGMKSGVWVRISEDSLQKARALGITEIGTGVLRKEGGAIAKHLKFDGQKLIPNKAIAFAPLGPAGAAIIASQIAAEIAAKELRAYLEIIDKKLDWLQKYHERKDEAELISWWSAVERAEKTSGGCGQLDSITWSQVSNAHQKLMSIASAQLNELQALRIEVEKSKNNVGDLKNALILCEDKCERNLAMLSHSLVLLNRVENLEIMHRASHATETRDSAWNTILEDRKVRQISVTEELEKLAVAINCASNLDNRQATFHPMNSAVVTKKANLLTDVLETFAKHAELEVPTLERITEQKWSVRAAGTFSDLRSDANVLVGRARMSSLEQLDRAKELPESLRKERKTKRELKQWSKEFTKAVDDSKVDKPKKRRKGLSDYRRK